jgi:hypothetical protein
MIRDGDPQAALAAARQVAAVEPEDPVVVIGLFDALVAAGEVAEARERLEGYRARAEEADDDDEGREIAVRLARLRRSQTGIPEPSAGSLDRLGQQLVGRDAVLARLLAEAERARSGDARRVVLLGRAGMGKTRVLEEFEARMRLRGARVVRVRILPGMREVQFAAFIDVVRALSALPGALGISERTATELVTLLPELVSRYPGVLEPSSRPHDLVLARRAAYADLLGSVTEERLVVVLVDDVQHADDSSRLVFASAERHPGWRLMEVWGTRPGPHERTLGADVEMALGPLGRADIRALLEGAARIPDAGWGTELVSRLEDRGRGVPQATLQLVRASAAAGLLVTTDGEWQAPDPPALLQAVGSMAVMEGLLDGLTSAERRLLDLLATWARPIEERDLVGVLALDSSAQPAGDWGSALGRLEGLGLVQSRDTSWFVGHDSVVDALAQSERGGALDDPFDLFLRYWVENRRLNIGVVEHFALLAGASPSPARSIRLVRAVSRDPQMRESGLHGRRLARTVARASGHAEWEQVLYRRIGFLARQTDWGLSALGVAATLLLGSAIWLAALMQPRLVVEAEPMGDETVPSIFELVVQPRLVVVDGFGRRRAIAGTVRARVDHGALLGDTIVPIVAGMAQFRTLTLRDDSASSQGTPAYLRFDGPWYARGATVRVRGVSLGGAADGFRVVSLTANGKVSTGNEVRAELGDSVRFDLTFEYSTLHATANYLVGAAPTWGARESTPIRLAGLPRPVQSAWRTVTFSVPSPAEAGVHHVIILFGHEESAANMFSSTSWTVGRPVWYDGNDLVDLGFDAIEGLRSTGLLRVPEYLDQGYPGVQSEVRVGERVVSRRPDQVTNRTERLWLGTAIRVEFAAGRAP